MLEKINNDTLAIIALTALGLVGGIALQSENIVLAGINLIGGFIGGVAYKTITSKKED